MRLGLELLTPERLAVAAVTAGLSESERKSVTTKSLLRALRDRERKAARAKVMQDFAEGCGRGFMKGFRSFLNPQAQSYPQVVELEPQSDLAFKLRLERSVHKVAERPNFPRNYRHKLHCGCRSGMAEAAELAVTRESHFVPYGDNGNDGPAYYREVVSRHKSETGNTIAIPWKRHSVRCLRDKRSERESAAIADQYIRQQGIRGEGAPVAVMPSAKRCMDACCKGK